MNIKQESWKEKNTRYMIRTRGKAEEEKEQRIERDNKKENNLLMEEWEIEKRIRSDNREGESKKGKEMTEARTSRQMRRELPKKKESKIEGGLRNNSNNKKVDSNRRSEKDKSTETDEKK